MTSAPSIARDLRRRIEHGEPAAGQPLPTRTELMRRYGVARATIDRAVGLLAQDAVVEARQGAGTWVRSTARAHRIAVIGSPLPERDIASLGALVTGFGYAQVAGPAGRRALHGFDGLLWNRPEAAALAWAEELAGTVPQVFINRTVPDRACVSTDHRGAYLGITAERLDLLPHARPYLLRQAGQASLVTQYRADGFTDACRARQRFHEQIAMPEGFEASLAQLERTLVPDPARPLLLVADSRRHTGAVMAWARRHALRWRHDLWYSDFDNDFGADVWGVEVTSFIQREADMHAAAVERLRALIEGRDDAPLHTLVAPLRRDGDT